MHRATKRFTWLALLKYSLYCSGLEPNPQNLWRYVCIKTAASYAKEFSFPNFSNLSVNSTICVISKVVLCYFCSTFILLILQGSLCSKSLLSYLLFTLIGQVPLPCVGVQWCFFPLAASTVFLIYWMYLIQWIYSVWDFYLIFLYSG